MNRVIQQFECLEVSIPKGATEANGFKQIIEEYIKKFRQRFEFSQLSYFQSYIMTIDHLDIAARFYKKVCKMDK